MKKYVRSTTIYIVLALAILLPVWTAPFYASQKPDSQEYIQDIPDSEPKVLTVGYSPIPGICTVDAFGNLQGLMIDYLNEIAKYNNWDYTYVEADPNDLINEFIEGKFDLVGGAYYLPSLEQYMAYPKYSMGNSKAVLLCRKDDPDIKSYELNTLNGKIIGVYGQADEKIRRLRDFLQLNSIQCGVRIYSIEDLSSEGDLYRFLENGDVDLLLGNETEAGTDFRIAAEFTAQPYYIVTRPGNQEILDGLNLGLEKILDSEPRFSDERYEKNFQNVDTSKIQLSQEELDYVAQKKTVTVAAVENWHPFYCLNNNSDHHSGILPDLLANISDYSGLTFNYVFTKTYEEAVELVKARKADMLGNYLDPQEYAAQNGLALSRSYMNLNNIIVKNKSANYPSDGLTAGIMNGRFMPAGIPCSQIRYYDSPEDCLRAVNSNEVDFAYGLSSSIEQEMQNHRYANVVPISSINNSTEICFAMDRPINPDLMTILNKAIGNLSTGERNALTNRNMVSMGYSSMSMSELIYANPLAFISIFSAFVLMAAASLVMIMRARLKNSMIQSELEKAEAKSKAKGEFLSRMSHEIRTPMNAIMGLANLTCMEEHLPAQVETNLKKILSSSQYLLSLINDILDMSRIENGKLQISPETFSLRNLLDDLESMMRTQAEARQLRFEVDFKLSHSSIDGDPVRLRQVLVNLLSNAIKFTPKGGLVQILVHETDSDMGTASFLFSVKDNGVGIPLEYQKRIFDSFEQLGSSVSRSEGTGLGLPISSSIVQAMGGKLELRSIPDKGSEFFFLLRFPLSQCAQETPKLSPAPDHMETGHAETVSLKGVRILLAEDNDLNAEIAVELLQMWGAQVDRACNGQEALDLFTGGPAGQYQAILMDIRMPVMDGLDATINIRSSSHPDSASVPIIAMTANSFKEDSDAAAKAGMTGFVSKPVDMDYLLKVLGENIRNA